MKKIAFIFLIYFFHLPYSSFSQSWLAYDSLRIIYQDKQSYDTALIYARKALHDSKKQFGEKDTVYAKMLSAMMEVNFYLIQYDSAIVYGERENEMLISSIGTKNTLYTDNCTWLAYIYFTLNNYQKADSLYLEAAEIQKELLGVNNPEYGKTLNNMAQLYVSQGKYEKAEQILIQTRKLFKETLGEKSSLYSTTLNNLGELYRLIGNYEKAEPLFVESNAIDKELLGAKNPDYAISLNNLAGLYWEMGDFKKAEPLLIEGNQIWKELLGENNPDYAKSLNNLASLYSRMGNTASDKDVAIKYYMKAEPLYIEAISIVEKVLGKKHQDYAMGLHNLGVLYKDMGSVSHEKKLAIEYYKKTEPLYAEAVNVYREALGEKHNKYMISVSNLATLYNIMGKMSEDKEVVRYYNNAAEPLYIEAINIVNSNIVQNFSFLSENEQEKYFKIVSGKYDLFNSFALKRKTENPAIIDMVYNNSVQNKGLLLKSSTAMRSTILGSNDSALISKYENWTAIKKELSVLYSTAIKKRKKDPKELEEKADNLEKELIKGSRLFSDFVQIQRLNWKDVQLKLNSNEAAIEFLNFKNNARHDSVLYCALVVKPDSKSPVMINLFYASNLENLLHKYQGNNLNYISNLYGNNSSAKAELYNLIWKPLEKELNDVKTVYISPSGLLNKISFSALCKEKDVYLCDQLNIEIKSSTGKIIPDNEPSTAGFLKEVTLFGGINYNTDSTVNKIWPFLEGTLDETNKIDEILKENNVNVNYFTKNEASEEEFKMIAGKSNILHVATHGFFYPDPESAKDENKQSVEYTNVAFRGGNNGFGVNNFVKNENPLMRSGLVFAGANDVWNLSNKKDEEDGVLTAQEVAQIDMRNSSLVVLSACETGLGDIKGSEGVYGLQRAFKMAGVKYIIMSLWQVPDKETVEFMETFYTKLLKIKNIRIAFSETQKEMRKKYDPYYWGAFVLIE